jgi:hypothetical protein
MVRTPVLDGLRENARVPSDRTLSIANHQIE